MPPQTMKQKNEISMERRKQAYDLLKALAQKCGIMQHGRDGHGYDEMIGMLESGEFRLELVSDGDENLVKLLTDCLLDELKEMLYSGNQPSERTLEVLALAGVDIDTYEYKNDPH